MSKIIKLAKGEPISFKYSSDVTIEITDEEVVVTDHVAAEAVERFGDYVSVTDAPVDAVPVVQDPQDASIPVIDPLPTPAPVDPEPAAPSDPTQPEATPADPAELPEDSSDASGLDASAGNE